MKKTAFVLALLAGVVLAIPAQAQEPGKSYFGLSYGANWTDGANQTAGTSNDGVAGGVRLYGGSMWSNWGMEFGYSDLGTYDIDLAGAPYARLKTQAVTLAAVYAAPLAAGYNLSAKLGIAFTRATNECVQCGVGSPLNVDTRKSGLSGVYGLGLEAKLASDIAMRVEVEHMGSVHHDIGGFEYNAAYDSLSVGIQFLF